ncbi:MAG: reverse transcriptase domain-containing protein [bacterium]|nr:reverse transcriptase domain-containing protein [bacterium]
MKKIFTHTYESIISVENLLEAWKEFLRGKKKKEDIQEFQARLMHNILELHRDLANKTYTHGSYQHFKISDPKPRDIHKAGVRDRLVHHALYRILYPFFDRTFIPDSYSCRIGKGTHKAMNRFRTFARRESHNHTKTCWVLKCDIKKFFASIDHGILLKILEARIADADILWLLREVISSFSSKIIEATPLGLPLGNLTSQLFANVYLNELDQFVKHKLRAEYYIRYADDFVILSRDRKWLEDMLPRISDFLQNELRLTLHPNKVSIETVASGVDFLGWVHFPNHRVLRTTTKKRMFKRTYGLEEQHAVVQSYLGLLSYGNGKKLQEKIISATINK